VSDKLENRSESFPPFDPDAKPSRDQWKRMPSPMKEPSHAQDECLGVGVDIRDNKRMQQSRRLTAIIEREGDGYLALCPELDIASQGDTLEGARVNLIEALALFFETADPSEVGKRLHTITSERDPVSQISTAPSSRGSVC
jgi:predicted RNase H-like HicB family nuclease